MLEPYGANVRFVYSAKVSVPQLTESTEPKSVESPGHLEAFALSTQEILRFSNENSAKRIVGKHLVKKLVSLLSVQVALYYLCPCFFIQRQPTPRTEYVGRAGWPFDSLRASRKAGLAGRLGIPARGGCVHTDARLGAWGAEPQRGENLRGFPQGGISARPRLASKSPRLFGSSFGTAEAVPCQPIEEGMAGRQGVEP